MFPIYYEDLTEEEKESGKQIVAQVESEISEGDKFAVTVTPTSDLYAAMYDDEHGYHQGEAAGEPVTLTLTAQANDGMVGLPIACAASESEDADALFNVTIILVYQA